MNDEKIRQIANILNDKEKILLLTHSKMDGDALGSIISTYIFLTKLGKEVTAVCGDPVPEVFKFLPTTDIIKTDFNGGRDFIVTLNTKGAQLDHMKYNIEDNKVNIIITPKNGTFSEKDVTLSKGESKYDLIITLDSPSLEMIGVIYENNIDIFFAIPIVNIDHHASNKHFGQINLIDVTSSSTTEILFHLFTFLQASKKLIDKDIATLLLAGIITDTGSFQNANTTPLSLEVAADLYDLGADQQEIIKNIYKTKKLSTLKLWGRVLSKLKNDSLHRIVWSSLNIQDFNDTKSSDDDTGGIIDELMSNAPGAEIFLLIKETKDHVLCGSLRTISPDVNASRIAAMFNGGGHTQAAGFKVTDFSDFNIAMNEVISKIKNYQKDRLGLDKKTEFVIPQEKTIKPVQSNSSVKKPSINSNKSGEVIDITEKIREGLEGN